MDGEAVALEYIRLLGYKLYAQNVRLGHNEIDIIAFDPENRILVFIEVKSLKKSFGDYSPLANFTHFKKKKLFRAVRKWVAKNEYEEGYRVDLICVVGGKVSEHFKAITFE